MRAEFDHFIPSTEHDAVLLAFGPDPEPECDGAGREAFAAIMAEMKNERRAERGLPPRTRREGYP